MKVIVAENCGFCPGVRNAISMAEKVLAQEKEVYSLGPIIHNKDVVQRLAKAGLKTVDTVKQIPHLLGKSTNEHARKPPKGPSRCGTVIIRSHGAAPKQIAELKEKGVNIVDATCVLVKRVQRIAKSLRDGGYKVVVIGDENHPEVQAVVDSAKDVVVIADESDLHKLPLNGKLGIVCQTTQSQEHFSKMLGAIGRHGAAPILELSPLACLKGQYPKIGAVYINTLCKEAIKRQESAVQLCKQVDIMFVLGGLQSANTRRLVELCKKYNSQTFHLQNWNEFDKNMIFGKKVALPLVSAKCRAVAGQIAGVTAGASTPEWIIAEFVENLTKIE